jgi:hypothetical protein
LSEKATAETARPATRDRSRPDPAVASAPDEALAPYDGLGNAALGRLLRSGRLRPKVAISEPSDPSEREADRVADSVIAGRFARHFLAESYPAGADPEGVAGESEDAEELVRRLGSGTALPGSLRMTLEPGLGRDLGDVRVHTTTAASDAAHALQARAFTLGSDIAFASSAWAPDTPDGRRLVAHELAHVAQQDGRPRVARRQRDPFKPFHDPMSDVVSDVPGAIPTDISDPMSDVFIDQTVAIAAPLLPGQKPSTDDEEQTYHLHSEVRSRIPISAYAVPRSRLTLDAQGAQPAAAASGPQPDAPKGASVYGPDHLPLAVLGSDAANVIVESSRIVHYAVGAGSCVLVHTSGGWYLFDAGINITESHALAEAVAEKIVTQLRGESIRAVFLTHSHYDHIKLLEWLARRVQIDSIVPNPLQITREEYAGVKEKMRVEDLARRKEARQRIEADPRAREEFVESLREGERAYETLNPRDVERLWRKEAAARVAQMYPRTTELVALPVHGTAGRELETIDTRPSRERGAPRLSVEDILPSREGGTDFRAIVDPANRPGRATMGEHEVDRMGTTFLLTIGGRRLIVLPDLRRTDLHRLRGELREALGGESVEFQEWIAGHHMQVGFMDVQVVTAKTLRETLELLHEFRAGGREGRAGRDAVIASVDAAQVSPSQIRLLRALGFETYLAVSQADVHTYEVLSGGKLIRGVRAPLAPGARGEPTLRRSIAGREQITAQKRLLDQRRLATPRHQRRPIIDEIAAVDARIEHLKGLEDALIDALRADPFDEAAATHAEQALNAALDAEHVGRVVTSSSQLTDTALVLLREPLGPEPAPGSPEAEQRARDVALREQKTRVDLMRERAQSAPAAERQSAYADFYAELAEYEHRLASMSESAGRGVTQDIAQTELARVRADRTALEKSFKTTDAARLPDGTLVENKVVRIAPPVAAGAGRGPSRTAQGMLAGLDVIGRGMGGVMLISTIRGAPELIQRYESGRANLPQTVLGGARELTSGWVGLRMIRGVPVKSGVFVVISALEVAEAMTGDYESETQRDRAVSGAVRNAAISTGCMYIGEALIDTMNPIGIAVGAVIMFLGPTIINLLFGDDTPESLYPEEVSAVDESLKQLMAEYRDVVGGLALERRDPAARADIGLAEDVSSQARQSILEHRMRALYLESQILPQFEAAYKRVREGRAGLRELDEMRKQFLILRARASTDESDEEARESINSRAGGGAGAGAGAGAGPSVPGGIAPYDFRLPVERDATGKPIPIRELTLRRFEAMEQSLVLDRLTADQVRKMEQWSSIRENASKLIREVMEHPKDPDWQDIAQRQADLEARLASARYRLAPEAQGEARRTALLASGTEARRVYEEELAKAKDTVFFAETIVLRGQWMAFKFEGIETPRIEALWKGAMAKYSSPTDARLALADDALDEYELIMKQIGGPPAIVGSVELLYREPSARQLYLVQMRTDAKFRKLLRRMEIMETSAQSMLARLDETVEAAPELPAVAPRTSPRGKLDSLKERFHRLRNERKVLRGILFLQELQDLASAERTRAVAYFAPRLADRPGEQPLATEEIAALETGEYGAAGRKLLEERRAIADRLALVRGLRAPSGPTERTTPTGETMHVSRALGGVMLLDGLTSHEKLLVGVVEPADSVGMVRILALNAAAAQVLHGYQTQPVMAFRLTPATEDDLPK